MKNIIKLLVSALFLFAVFIFLIPQFISASPNDNKTVKVHLKDVYKAEVDLIHLLSNSSISKANLSSEKSTHEFVISENNLPGEFLIRIQYYINESDNRPRSGERMFIVGNQDLELWINPMFPNNPNYSYFQDGEKENSFFVSFMRENSKNMEMLDLLQNFLLNYDDKESEFYKKGIIEFQTRRNNHNEWLRSKQKKNSDLFSSSLLSFYYVPDVNWDATDMERQQNLIDNYFDGIDFSDSQILKSSSLKAWMDNYVSLYSNLPDARTNMDSLFTAAGFNAIEKAKKGDPLVYGWMVDYFFQGYEAHNIQEGIAMLAPYIADENCKTERRREIQRRLEGIESLIPGAIAPNIELSTEDGLKTNLWEYNSDSNIVLLLFWSADCAHCADMAKRLYAWYIEGNNSTKVDILALSLDDDEVEVEKWENMKPELEKWHHQRLIGGVNSAAANSYFVLATPTMYLVDPENNRILSSPHNLRDLIEDIEKINKQ